MLSSESTRCRYSGVCLFFGGAHKENPGGHVSSVVEIRPLQVIWDGQSREDRQTPVPHVENGANWLSKGDVERVQVLRADGIVERQRSRVIVQQYSETPQVGRRLNRHLLAVVTHRPRVIAARQHPGGGVFANPLLFWCGLVCNAHRKPASQMKSKKARLNRYRRIS